MGSRVVDHYGLRSSSSFVSTSSLDDLNDGEAGQGLDGIGGIGVGAAEDELVNDDSDSAAVECVRSSFRSALPLHDVAVKHDSESLENNGPLRSPYHVWTIDDVSPIESARARFLQIVVDHFIIDHVIEVTEPEVEYAVQSGQDKLSRGNPGKCITRWNSQQEDEVALEAAGGLYRRLAKKFPKKGSCSFRRRELATFVETRTRFPELVIQEEKRVRFVVVNGLDIIERPIKMPVDDAEWFERLTGRSEVAVCPRDYKFYFPRNKYRRVSSNSVSDISDLPSWILCGWCLKGQDMHLHCCHFMEVMTRPKQVLENFVPFPKRKIISGLENIISATLTSASVSCYPTESSSVNAPKSNSVALSTLELVTLSQTLAPHIACLQPPGGGHVGDACS